MSFKLNEKKEEVFSNILDDDDEGPSTNALDLDPFEAPQQNGSVDDYLLE